MLQDNRGASTINEQAALRAMFRARKDVFIDLLKWDVPVLAGQFEIDQFDTVDAEYLILLGEGGCHSASARLLRTDREHLLADVFPHLCAGPVPRGPTIREITRFCLDRHQTAVGRHAARNQLVTALVEHARATGITAFTGVADLQWFEQVRRFGWKCEPLGQPLRHGSQMLTALHIAIEPNTLEMMRAAGFQTAAGNGMMTARFEGARP